MAKKTLEINPYNNIIKRINEKLDGGDNESKTLNDLVHLLFDVTLQSSGFTLDDPSTFSNRILKLINIGLGVDNDEHEDNVQETHIEENIEQESSMEQVD